MDATIIFVIKWCCSGSWYTLWWNCKRCAVCRKKTSHGGRACAFLGDTFEVMKFARLPTCNMLTVFLWRLAKHFTFLGNTLSPVSALFSIVECAIILFFPIKYIQSRCTTWSQIVDEFAFWQVSFFLKKLSIPILFGNTQLTRPVTMTLITRMNTQPKKWIVSSFVLLVSSLNCLYVYVSGSGAMLPEAYVNPPPLIENNWLFVYSLWHFFTSIRSFSYNNKKNWGKDNATRKSHYTHISSFTHFSACTMD